MSAEDIVDVLNRYIESVREGNMQNIKGHIVLQKQITQHPVIKLYSIHKQVLWYINGDKKYTICGVTSTHRNDKYPSHESKKYLLDMLFGLIHSDKFQSIINGTYNG